MTAVDSFYLNLLMSILVSGLASQQALLSLLHH